MMFTLAKSSLSETALLVLISAVKADAESKLRARQYGAADKLYTALLSLPFLQSSERLLHELYWLRALSRLGRREWKLTLEDLSKALETAPSTHKNLMQTCVQNIVHLMWQKVAQGQTLGGFLTCAGLLPAADLAKLTDVFRPCESEGPQHSRSSESTTSRKRSLSDSDTAGPHFHSTIAKHSHCD